MPTKPDKTDATHITAALLTWYDRHARSLPWRVMPGEGRRPDPYAVWLSEIMLQQTTVATATGYFLRFMAQWPDVRALAAAPREAVLAAWAGLGYYARARNLHACAIQIADQRDGRFPEEEAMLRTLPGIGAYTAAAVAAIAFDRRAVAVDGNVRRLVARLFRIDAVPERAKAAIHAGAAAIMPDTRCGDVLQAMMDLGATVCTPRKPRCAICPLAGACAGRDMAEALPRRRVRKTPPLRRGVAFWITRADGAVLLRRRPERGLLGGMTEIPSSAWRELPHLPSGAALKPFLAEAPVAGRAAVTCAPVSHVFSHFRLELAVTRLRWAGKARGAALPDDCFWCPPEEIDGQALPGLMRKIATSARSP